MIDQKEILIANKNSLMGFYISQTLVNKDLSVVQTCHKDVTENVPVIFFLLNEEKDSSLQDDIERIEDFMKKHQLKPNPVFFITTKTMINSIGRMDYLGAIVEIQIDPILDDVLSYFEQMKDTINPIELEYIESVMNEISNVIANYVNHPPNLDEYIIEEISIEKSKSTIGIVGLGYVGLPVAIGFSEKYQVIGYDVDEEKINLLQKGIDQTGEVSAKELEEASIEFTTQAEKLKYCSYIIVIVPTPITTAQEPDLTALKSASKTVGENLTVGTIVIYESTVYPGVTEEVCIPVLERHSNLTAGEDFYVGYSPERINPGDREHTFKKNSKVVSGQNDFALEKVYNLYNNVLDAEIHQAPTIKVAEASKIIENTQRDVNIALINELAIIFNHLDIDTSEVLRAAETKWNFLPFTPGLVGGHCIGVDPYYLIHQSKINGYDPKFITSARYINDQMPNYIVKKLLELVMDHHLNFKNLKVTVLGITFKENISDIRNSKALEIVTKLKDLGISVQVCDPMIPQDSFQNDQINLKQYNQLEKAHVLIFTVPHEKFAYKDKHFLNNLLMDHQGIVMDIKGKVPNNVLRENIVHWKL